MDQITVEAARRGDRDAQSNLLRQLQDPWFRMCVGLLGNPDAAQDAVQETAFRFLRQLPQFRGDSSILTWSFGIAINVCRESRRKSRPMLSINSQQDGPSDSSGEPLPITSGRPDESPEAVASLSESKSMLQQTLAELPERQREAVLLRFFQDLSIDETAAAMHCASGTVKATVHQALRTLRSKLGQLI